jgi:16S rRNA processing protein RimM
VGGPDLLEIGRIDRAHGLGGDVLVRLVSNNPDRLVPGAELDADGRQLKVVSVRAHQDRWLVTLEGVHGREAAGALGGTILRAPAVTDDPDGYWVHDLIGAEVLDTTGAVRGSVVQVIDNPASDLLELDSGPLVPLRFATWAPDSVPGHRRLVVEGPEGLLDL